MPDDEEDFSNDMDDEEDDAAEIAKNDVAYKSVEMD